MELLVYDEWMQDQLRVLSEELLGVNYIDITTLTADNCIVACIQKEVVGFCIYHSLPESFSLTSIGVKPSHQGKGIAGQLGKHVLAKYPNQWTSPGWIHPDGKVPSDKLLRSLGFTPSQTISNYWYEDSLQRMFYCPKCGNPCVCSALIYVKHRL